MTADGMEPPLGRKCSGLLEVTVSCNIVYDNVMYHSMPLNRTC